MPVQMKLMAIYFRCRLIETSLAFTYSYLYYFNLEALRTCKILEVSVSILMNFPLRLSLYRVSRYNECQYNEFCSIERRYIESSLYFLSNE